MEESGYKTDLLIKRLRKDVETLQCEIHNLSAHVLELLIWKKAIPLAVGKIPLVVGGS